ncbi:MAG: alpha/beta fold hydrolase [Anaerolineales bacterium]|nr:alpha/beta fold hydrolase [Anaerolineales bacterium]
MTILPSPAVPLISGFAEVNQAQLYYEVMGAGYPLILIHAGIADRRMWDDQFTFLAQYHRVIRYDVRGFGNSRTVETGGVTYSDHQDLYSLLKFLGVDRAFLLGVSNGGRIALDFTLAYPSMVQALLPICSALGGYEFTDEATKQKDAAGDAALARGDIAQAVELNLQLWVDGPGRTPEQISPIVRERVREMLTQLCHRSEDTGERQPLDPAAITRLNEIYVPTLVIIGDQDVLDMLTIADLLAAGISRAEKVIMPHVAHLPNLEKPEEFNQIVLDFLNRFKGDLYRG